MAKLWMLVSRDKFQFPIKIANSAEELAEMTGKKVSTIHSIISKGRKMPERRCTVVCVDVDEED